MERMENPAATRRRLDVISRHLKPCSFSTYQPSPSIIPRYRYTLDEGTLPEEARAFYEENGYYVVKNLVSLEHLETYASRFHAICNKTVEIPGSMTVMKDISCLTEEGEHAVNKVQSFQDDPVLSTYLKLPQILTIVQNFVGPDIFAMHNMLINKPPDSGLKTSRHPLHQDLYYFPFRPAERIVASWTAMQKVNQANGCLSVIPGTHKGELLKHGYPEWEGGVNKMYHGIIDLDPSWKLVHLEMEPGDTVFFHPLLIHGSGMNRTNGFRKAISAHFASSFCHYIDVKGTAQEVIEKEIQEIAHQKFGHSVDLSLKDVWDMRKVLVQGKEGTM